MTNNNDLSLTVRSLARLAFSSQEEIEEMRRRDAKRKPGDPIPFPLLYTGRLKNAGKDVFSGKGVGQAYQRVANFNDNLRAKGERVIDGFDAIVTQHPEIDFTPQPAPKGCFEVIGGTTLRMAPDSVGLSEDGKLLFFYFHVIDAAQSQAAVDLLLNAAALVAKAKNLDAEVALVDAPRSRLIRLTGDGDSEVVEAALRDVRGKKAH